MPPTCPTTETLAAFVRGDLPPDDLAAVADHVDGCAACGRALQFVPEDSLAGLARAAAAADTVPRSAGGATAIAPGVTASVPEGFADHPRYRIVGRLGAGGMGTVYKAEDLWMGRVIAIKIVSPHLTAKASAIERFRKEIRVAAQLNDPRMVIAHDTGEAGGCQFLVMEYVDGFSLDRLVARKGPLPVHTACALTRSAALGLQHAAEKGMVHRDIKPQNLMVTRKGQLKILDFGLARFAHSEADEGGAGGRLPFGAGKALGGEGLTNPHMLMGTPDYLSPEQAKNSHDVDHRSDIYSLGCTLYFLLTGVPPFGAAEALLDKLLAHTHEAAPSPCDVRPEVPAGLDSILSRMMAKRPEERYQTAAEVAAALLPFTRADAARGEPVFEVVEAVVVAPARAANFAPSGPLSDTAPAAHQRTLADTPAPRPRRPRKKKPSWWKRRKGTVVTATVAAVLLLVGGAVANTVRKKLADPAPDATAALKPSAGDAPPRAADAQPRPDVRDEKTDKTDQGEKPDKPRDEKPPAPPPPTPPLVIAPQKRPQVLYVLPSDGVSLKEFGEVRDHLVKNGVTVVTASLSGDLARPGRRPAGPPLPPVPVDKALRADMDLSDYAAVLFCGDRVDEYVSGGRGAQAAGAVIQRMLATGKPVGAIASGLAVLATHGTLKGKRAAHSWPLVRAYPNVPWDKLNINWETGEKGRVVVDDKIVTAGGPREAAEFADAVLKLIGEK
ncbi:protein kinase [Gemmata sp. JC673]|uniref:Protein kinase n=1 Tax=Gemmata algarum TaxID=2975278 RepID=A0ABU5F1Y0_9BACT|nr:protein kinase [Gemmata algarum]MDY3561580.1 protein kinase [Gemmata algarum]